MVVLAVVQGATEFLPISSSAHLVAVSEVFLGGHAVGIDIALHAATLAAVLLYFREDVIKLTKALFLKEKSGDKSLAWALIVAILPIVIVGVFAYEILTSLRMVPIVAITLIASGALLIVADYGIHHRWLKVEMPLWRKGLSIGLLQVLAILPGVSRSGITIAGGRLVGLSRKEASRFSFLLAIPVIIGALVLLLVKSPTEVSSFGDASVGTVFLGAIIAFAVAYAVIQAFLKLIDRIGFMPFFIYQIIAGVTLLITAA